MKKKSTAVSKELLAPGDRGTIARLRQSCRDAASILEGMARQLRAEPLTKAQARQFAKALDLGATRLRNIVFFSRAERKGARLGKDARLQS